MVSSEYAQKGVSGEISGGMGRGKSSTKQGGKMKKLSKEELLEECELALNSAVAKAHQQYPYRKKRIEQAREQIVALIKKPGVTEEWIEDKALILLTISFAPEEAKNRRMVAEYKDFIRKLMEENRGKNKSRGIARDHLTG